MLNSPLLHTQTSTSFTINFAINSFPSSVPQERNKARNRDIYIVIFFETMPVLQVTDIAYSPALNFGPEFWAEG